MSFKATKHHLFIILSYLLISILFFLSILESRGIVIGGDWATPFTSIQIDTAYRDSFATWNHQSLLIGKRHSLLSTLPYYVTAKIFSLLGFNGDFFTKIVILYLFTLSGYTMYVLSKYFKFSSVVSFITGLIYITSPLYLNYISMGWIFILHSLSILPLATYFFIRSVKENSIFFTIITAILFSVAVSSQSVIWFMIVFLSLSLFLINSKKRLFIYIRTNFLVLLTFILLNLYWLLGIFMVKDANIVGSDIVNSEISLGITAHFKPHNIIRLFGSLYNAQYEYIINESFFKYFSFTLVFLVTLSLFLNKNRKKIIALWGLALVPIAMFVLNKFRSILLYIPFSNVIRDFARFTSLSTFAYSLLAGFTLDFLKQKKFKTFIFFCSILFISIYPWWSGEISKWQNLISSDIRLRTKIYPQDYIDFEKLMSQEKLLEKALFMPLGTLNYFEDDEKYGEGMSAIPDIFASFSTVPGAIYISDRNLGVVDSYLKLIKENRYTDLLDIIKVGNIRFIVVKKNIKADDKEKLLKSLKEKEIAGDLNTFYESQNLLVYESKYFTPRFYVPSTVEISDESIFELTDLLKKYDTTQQPLIVFKEHQTNLNKVKGYQQLDLGEETLIEYNKIDSTTYVVKFSNYSGSRPLVFTESFHPGWKLYLLNRKNDEYVDNKLFISQIFANTRQNNNLIKPNLKETLFIKQLEDQSHFIANSFANAWTVDSDKICSNNSNCIKNKDGSYDFSLMVQFLPQRYFYFGSIISAITLIGCFIYLLNYFITIKNKRND